MEKVSTGIITCKLNALTTMPSGRLYSSTELGQRDFCKLQRTPNIY
jgi:hypothetical protein